MAGVKEVESGTYVEGHTKVENLAISENLREEDRSITCVAGGDKAADADTPIDVGKNKEISRATAWNALKIIFTIFCGMLLLLSLVNHIYLIITWDSKRACYLNTLSQSDLVAPFTWQTTWALLLSSLLFVWFLIVYFSKDESGSWSFQCLFQVVLCWTVSTMVGYSMVLIVFGGPETDKTNCYTVLDSVVERKQPNAVFWLVMDRIDNVTAHYVCGIVSLGVFYFQIIPYDISMPIAPVAALLLWIVIGSVQNYHGVVYDVAINIWLVGLMSVGINTILHFLFLLLNKRFESSKFLHEEIERKPPEESERTTLSSGHIVDDEDLSGADVHMV